MAAELFAPRVRAPVSFNCNLYVKNLDKDKVTDETLKGMFAKYGKITDSRVMKEKDTSRSRGFGFVCFEKKEDATAALEMHNADIFGKKLFVSLAIPKKNVTCIYNVSANI